MNMDTVTHDRGLGSAYERYCFYQLVDEWARRYKIESALEGPVDGMAGALGVHCVGLARRGIPVLSAVQTEEQAVVTRGIYELAGGGAHADVRVVHPWQNMGNLPQADLVIAYHSLSVVPDWRSYLTSVSKLARKLLVVTVCNPDNWGVSILRTIGRLRGISGLEPPEVWHKETLGPALWEIGRVCDHVYFDCPWWPDLQVSPGQSLLDRAKKLVVTKRKQVSFTATGEDSELAARFVYGSSKWPYFGGEGWVDELLPALLRHPAFDGASNKRLANRMGHLHAFLVDMSPRTPQARRKLARVGEESRS